MKVVPKVDVNDSVASVISVSTPYFQARFSGAARMLAPVTLHSVEMGRYSDVYPFDPHSEVSPYQRHILDDVSLERQKSHELVSRLTKTLEKIRPAVVFIPGWSNKAAFAALSWCVSNHVPAVAMSESTEWDTKRRAWSEELKRRLVGLCSAALVGGTPHRDYMVKLGMLPERVFLGYDAVDNEYFAREAQRARSQAAEAPRSPLPAPRSPTSGLRSQVSALPSAPYFLASARFVEKKNLARLLQAYARYRELAQKSEVRSQKSESQVSGLQSQVSGFRSPVSDLRPPTSDHRLSVVSSPVVAWSLVLLGDGPLISSLRSQVSSLGLQDSVLLPGFKQYPELPVYYAQAGAFIHASTTEQWGLVVNEAMASGLPVLVSNRCGCAQDLVQEGVNGYTFDPYVVEQLAQLMLQVSGLRSPVSETLASETPKHRLAEMGAASRAIVNNWGPDRFASGLKAAAECALKVGPKPATLLQRMILKILLNR